MSLGDVRGVLQYVPQFRGKTFAVFLDQSDLPEPAVAEAILDLKALQEIGVRLVIGMFGGELDDLLGWFAEVELKFAESGSRREGADFLTEARGILERGQAIVVDCRGREIFDPEVAGRLAELESSKLIALTNGPGVTIDGGPLHAVSVAEAKSLVAGKQVEGWELLAGAAKACEAGLPRVHVLDGRRQGVVAQELFSNEGVGTMIHTDNYREIRALREEDIPELLAMVGRSVRASHLVPRSYEEIEQQAGSYLVLCLDENVVGCVALYEYGGSQTAEIGCLYVKQSHEGIGYGRLLVEEAEVLARERGVPRVFALTNRAAGFFVDHLGYTEGSEEDIPEERRTKLKTSGRESTVLVKALS